MPTAVPEQIRLRAERAVRRLRQEGLGLLRTAFQRRQLPSFWEARSSATHHFQDKLGVELGGPTGLFRRGCPLAVYPLAGRVDNCSFSEDMAANQAQRFGPTFRFDDNKPPGNQYFCEANHLTPLASDSYDFLLASHCIEQLANPLRGLLEWQRVLCPGGVLLLVVPHKDCTVAHKRPTTQLSHLVSNYDRTMPETSRGIHHHVFDTRLTVAAIDWAGYQILNVQLLRPCHVVVLAQKLQPGARKNNAAFLTADGSAVWRSPLPSDQSNR